MRSKVAKALNPQGPTKDTPVMKRKVTWAVILAAIPGLMFAAPDLARAALPFIPEPYRDRWTAGATVILLFAGVIWNRSAVKDGYEENAKKIDSLEKSVRFLVAEKENSGPL